MATALGYRRDGVAPLLWFSGVLSIVLFGLNGHPSVQAPRAQSNGNVEQRAKARSHGQDDEDEVEALGAEALFAGSSKAGRTEALRA